MSRKRIDSKSITLEFEESTHSYSHINKKACSFFVDELTHFEKEEYQINSLKVSGTRISLKNGFQIILDIEYDKFLKLIE